MAGNLVNEPGATIQTRAAGFSVGGIFTNNGNYYQNGAGPATIPPVTGTGNMTVVRGTVTTPSFAQSSVSITGGTLAVAVGTSRATNTASSFTVSGTGSLDLAGNNLQINYGTNASPDAAVRQYLTSGYNAGAWTGTGGVTSSQAAANPSKYALGYADGKDNVVAGLA